MPRMLTSCVNLVWFEAVKERVGQFTWGSYKNKRHMALMLTTLEQLLQRSYKSLSEPFEATQEMHNW